MSFLAEREIFSWKDSFIKGFLLFTIPVFVSRVIAVALTGHGTFASIGFHMRGASSDLLVSMVLAIAAAPPVQAKGCVCGALGAMGRGLCSKR